MTTLRKDKVAGELARDIAASLNPGQSHLPRRNRVIDNSELGFLGGTKWDLAPEPLVDPRAISGNASSGYHRRGDKMGMGFKELLIKSSACICTGTDGACFGASMTPWCSWESLVVFPGPSHL